MSESIESAAGDTPILTTSKPDGAPQERSFDESGAQRLERQLFFAMLGGMLLLVAWLGRFAFGFDQQVADIAATLGAPRSAPEPPCHRLPPGPSTHGPHS